MRVTENIRVDTAPRRQGEAGTVEPVVRQIARETNFADDEIRRRVFFFSQG